MFLLLGFSFASVGSSNSSFDGNRALRMALNAESGVAPPRLPNGNFVSFPSGAYVHSAMEQIALQQGQAPAPAPAAAPTIGTNGCPNVFSAPGIPDNVRANQDCGYRFQSEEWVAVNPTDPNNVVVSQNDSSLNGNHTGVEYSIDGGQHFGDSRLPSGRILIPGLSGGEWSFDFFSDPVHAFDARGQLYYSALGADFAQDGFDGLFVWKSNSCFKGSALHTPGSGSCSPFREPRAATAIPVRTNFDNPGLSDDKELMAVDANPASPHAGDVYITWTIFNFTCGPNHDSFCDAPIFFSRSGNGGRKWSPATEISGANPDICDFGDTFDPSQPPDACNNDQFSDPVVGPDGTIYVFFMNYNTTKKTFGSPGGLVNQILMVKSTDGGDTWTDPTRVSRDIAREPYSLPGHRIRSCDLFRQCLPPNGYRMADYPTVGIDGSGKITVYWSDFRHGGPCAKDTDPGLKGLPVLPCDNINADILATTSTDGGDTWGTVHDVTKDAGLSAQWQPWGALSPGGTQYVAYYDRQYGDCESSGCNDITLGTSHTDGRKWAFQRITTGSMPNAPCRVTPECGFLGDYMGLAVGGGNVHMAWGDTRGQNGTVEEDVYHAAVPASP